MPAWHPVMPLDALRQGMTDVEVAGARVLLVRQGDAVHAVQATCPHKFTLLSGGTLGDGVLTCPLHAARFDLRTGKPRPGGEFAGVLPTYPVRVRDGTVEVDLPP